MPASLPPDSRRLQYVEEYLVPSAAKTATWSTTTQSGFGATKSLRLQLEVTAASGTTPTLNVLVEDSLDGTNWNTIGTFAQKTAASREVINITSPYADRIRVTSTIGGTTPSFTYSVICASEVEFAI